MKRCSLSLILSVAAMACGGGDAFSPIPADGAVGDGATDATSDGTTLDGSSDGVAQDGSDGGAGDGSSDALIDNSDGFTCNPTWTPSDNNCVVDDAFGVFVSPNGADGAAGTKAAPLKKFQDGVAKAKMAGKRLYVCAGTYAENVVVTATNDGVRVYGGLDCTQWTYNATANRVKVAPSSGYALNIDSLVTGATIEDIEFDAADATAAGGSSIAALVNGSQNVVLRRATVKAGNAVAGARGSDGVNTWSGAGLTGNPGSGTTGGPTLSCTCGGSGGRGGAAGVLDTGSGTVLVNGGDGASGTVGTANLGTGAKQGQACTPGGTGADGAPGSGGAGATSIGSLSSAGWANSSLGASGVAGSVAQGGGGGGGGLQLLGGPSEGGSGGGGCGGCGGAPGAGGTAGGSSIALVSVASGVTLDAVTLTSTAGGGGGNGGNGTTGQAKGAAGVKANRGCDGGVAGNGGTGGAGAGGAGGHSIAIAYSGTQPTEVGTVTKNVGAAGGGGQPGTGAPNPGNMGAGVTGLSVAVKGF